MTETDDLIVDPLHETIKIKKATMCRYFASAKQHELPTSKTKFRVERNYARRLKE
ncbi:hypothetical protein LGQ02_01175 [Bacillus shivajii]|uniref:hypothetical protein n=1 Tax=Bacillus shivajii TaxID=1983719 RepID=UPI001CFBCD6A|nr:hypothetical protein [Bacillus shivajii]UCZ53442.1 hypothetical protein LGQ02_01175 [Bacillus shivajii]